jgi:hypothetical protein
VKIISNLFHKGGETDPSSLNTQFSSLEWMEATRDAALQLWRTSLLTLSDCMPNAPKQIAEPHRRGLKQIVEELPSKPAPNHLEQRKQKTTELLKSYGSQLGTFIDTQDREAKSVLTAVGQLTETLSALDQKHSVRLQGVSKKLKLLATLSDLSEIRAKLAAEVTQLEKCLEEQQRDTRGAVSRLTEDVNASEIRRHRATPGPGSHLMSDSLLALDRAIGEWERYCLVRYELTDRNGNPPPVPYWKEQEPVLQQAIPERIGNPVRVVSPRPGVLLAAVNCQLLEYAGMAEGMEKALAAASGLVCRSRVVEPLRGEAMREAVARLEKVG